MVKKILKTIIISIMLFVLFIVCFQRFYITIKQKYNNTKINKYANYKIMCLGDSTTAGEYPIQLQQILNDKYPNKFSVIDCGIEGVKLITILDLLNDNINKYKPNIVICMMGNIEQISILQKINKTFSNTNDSLFANNASLSLVFQLKNNGKFKEAEKILKELLNKKPNDEKVFMELCLLYYYKLNKQNLGYNMATEAINKNFSNKEEYYHIVFGYCSSRNMINELKYYINKAINENINIFNTHYKFILYDFIENQLTREQQKKILEVMLISDDLSFGFLAMQKLKQQDYTQAEKYFNKAEEIRLKFPDIKTYDTYKLIVKKLIDNNIKVICMQYPVRSIKPLQEQLKNEPYYDKITFVSNEKLFKDALIKKDYDEIFRDQIGGDFGHCTDLGNTIIAKNVVITLKDILNLK